MTLAELGSVKIPLSFEEELDPHVAIGVTGIVLPDRLQLARWFKVPSPPKYAKSKLHQKALRDGKQHALFTFFSTFSFETVFFTPNLTTLSIALLVAIGSGCRSWATVNRHACEEDRAIALELNVRKHAYRARTKA